MCDLIVKMECFVCAGLGRVIGLKEPIGPGASPGPGPDPGTGPASVPLLPIEMSVDLCRIG